MAKLNNSDQYESLMVHLTPQKTPIAYEQRVQDLMMGGMSRQEAGKNALKPYELELYYEPGVALFAVDSMAVESGTIYSPYSGDLCEDADNENEKIQ